LAKYEKTRSGCFLFIYINKKSEGSDRMKMFWQKLAKLIDVKSMVTFALTATFVYLSAKGDVKPEIFMTVYTSVIAFYFGTQYEKNNDLNRKE
jgi:hypothetical protein